MASSHYYSDGGCLDVVYRSWSGFHVRQSTTRIPPVWVSVFQVSLFIPPDNLTLWKIMVLIIIWHTCLFTFMLVGHALYSMYLEFIMRVYILLLLFFWNVGVDAIVIGSCSCGRSMWNRTLFFPPGIFVCWGRWGAGVLQHVLVLFSRDGIFGCSGFSSTSFAWWVGQVLVSRLGGLIFMSLVSGNWGVSSRVWCICATSTRVLVWVVK